MEFTNGWSEGRVELQTLDGSQVLYWLENDFIINKSYLDKPARIESDWKFNGLDFGMIMKYNDNNGFLLLTFNGAYATLSKITTDAETYHAQVISGTKCTIPENTQVTIAVEITDYTYRFYAFDKLIFTKKIEDNSYAHGNVGLYSRASNYCKAFRIYSDIPNGWTFTEPSDELIDWSTD